MLTPHSHLIINGILIVLAVVIFLPPAMVIYQPFTSLHFNDDAQCTVGSNYIQGYVNINGCGSPDSDCPHIPGGTERVYYVNATLGNNQSVNAVTCFATYGHTGSHGYQNGYDGFLNTWMCQSCLFSVTCDACINPSSAECQQCKSQLCVIPVNQTVPCAVTFSQGQYVAFIRNGQDRPYVYGYKVFITMFQLYVSIVVCYMLCQMVRYVWYTYNRKAENQRLLSDYQVNTPTQYV